MLLVSRIGYKAERASSADHSFSPGNWVALELEDDGRCGVDVQHTIYELTMPRLMPSLVRLQLANQGPPFIA